MEQLLDKIRQAAYEVRTYLRAGFLESVYKNALLHELRLMGLDAKAEMSIPVIYKNTIVGDFRADIVVENKVILELKATSEVTKIHEAQLVNYLVATNIDHGFLINYGGDQFRIIYKSRVYDPRR